MSVRSRFSVVAFVTVVAMSALATTNANAFPPPPPGPGPGGPGFGPHPGFGPGLLGAAVIGSAIAASQNYGCGWVRQYDAYGNFAGRVRVCN